MLAAGRLAVVVSGTLALALASAAAAALTEQERPDLNFHYQIAVRAYPPGAGPTLGIDSGHHNFNTAQGRYAPFAGLVADDGFRVESLTQPFDAAALAHLNILVIVNALNAFNADNWVLPTPSAFTPGEITAVKTWVEGGGSLLLIADHMPFAGAASDLGKAFGFGFVNGFAFKADDRTPDFTFTKDSGLVLDDLGVGLPPTTKVVTFTGQAFTIPKDAIPLLVLVDRHFALLPGTWGEFTTQTPSVDVTGYAQGAIRLVGRGRLAVFGEAATFSAQISGDGSKFGMNAPEADENAGFALKVVRWLAHFRPPQ